MCDIVADIKSRCEAIEVVARKFSTVLKLKFFSTYSKALKTSLLLVPSKESL